MAYTKNTWKTGDIVSSQKLNHMEDGIANAGGVMVINRSDDTLDKTWQEIYDAMAQGKMCVIRVDFESREVGITTTVVNDVVIKKGEYLVRDGQDISYSASSATGYPTVKGPE